ncbi:hypothetical protein DYB38_004154 [Aphanomyces astaci]|uniref:Uncharacterized protein n=1 Tax=Aphanomyces astaci TaxID=112090 RepID=A0A397C0G9_APHAT|nr:hypothetical protein DYB38_004154 [Aphanomyces astaci]
MKLFRAIVLLPLLALLVDQPTASHHHHKTAKPVKAYAAEDSSVDDYLAQVRGSMCLPNVTCGSDGKSCKTDCEFRVAQCKDTDLKEVESDKCGDSDMLKLTPRAEWIRGLEQIQALKSSIIIPGHALPGDLTDDEAPALTAAYLREFEAQIPLACNSADLIAAMQKKYPASKTSPASNSVPRSSRSKGSCS